jgi:transcriptional regulator with XRE-family HTH domain
VATSVTQVFGSAVKTARREKGLSQEQLAAKSGLDRTYISGVERGARNPSLKSAQRIANALGKSLPALLEGS